MKKVLSFLAILTACLVLFWFIDLPDLVAVAQNDNDFENYCQSEGIDYMASGQYEKLVTSLIEGNDYSDAYYAATGSHKISTFGINLDKNDSKTTNTNFSGSGIISAINDVLELGKKIYDAVSDGLKNQEYGTDWDADIPVASQLIGKTKIYYDNGVVELITLGVSFVRYWDSTPAIDMYRNKMQIYGIRQIVSMAGYAATDFTVDINDGFVPCQYDSATMLAYGAYSSFPIVHDNSDTGESFKQGSGFYSTLGFNRSMSSYADYFLYFTSLQQQAVTYNKVEKYLKDSDLYLWNARTSNRDFTYISVSGNPFSQSKYNPTSSIIYTISDMQTNNRWDYVSATHHDQVVYEPSVTYNNVYNAGDKITNNNYKNYGYDYDIDNKTWNYDTDYYNEWLTNYNNTAINNYYNNYQTIDNSGSVFGDISNTTIKPFGDPEEPETQQPTDPPTQPPTETYPPATIPTQPPETVPPVSLSSEWLDDSVQLDTSHYTMDYDALESNFLELESFAVVPEGAIKGTGILFHIANDVFEETGLLPFFLMIGIVVLVVSFF